MELPVFRPLVAQPRVRQYLDSVAQSRKFAHAYLFIGPPGSMKGEAAEALAASILCEKGEGCAACDACIRVAHRTHPDVHWFKPEGAHYVVDQVREITRDAQLLPIRGSHKVYILERADLLGEAAANALLKTLEEPPESVVFILCGRSESTMLPTIVSRCQVVPFRRIPPHEAIAVLVSETGASEVEAQEALAMAGTVIDHARALLLSSDRWEARKRMLDVIARIADMDDLGVLAAARELLGITKIVSEEARVQMEHDGEATSEFLSREGAKRLEQRQKRELSARDREGLEELFCLCESYFRDCVMLADGFDAQVVNHDMIDRSSQVSALISAHQFISIHHSIDRARERISYNGVPQLVLETMLFDMREVLKCQK